jgi:class 3 adenylate cyclase
MFVLDARPASGLRCLPFLALLGLRLVVHGALIAALLSLNILYARLRGELWADSAFRAFDFAQDFFVALLAMALLLFVFQMRNLIGGRTLRNFVIGRYAKPVSETRVFLLVDLVGSSPLAERLGDERFHAFLATFFFDIDQPIVESGGEVYSYVGDALIASWPQGDAASRHAALAATAEIFATLARRAEYFRRHYGEAPRARAALHVGPVVAGECGDSRRQITYLGATLNAVARLEALAKDEGAAILATAAMVEGIDLPAGLSAKPLGPRRLAGFGEDVPIMALACQTARS